MTSDYIPYPVSSDNYPPASTNDYLYTLSPKKTMVIISAGHNKTKSYSYTGFYYIKGTLVFDVSINADLGQITPLLNESGVFKISVSTIRLENEKIRVSLFWEILPDFCGNYSYFTDPLNNDGLHFLLTPDTFLDEDDCINEYNTYCNEPSIVIHEFGNIPLSRNLKTVSGKTLGIFQFFKGSFLSKTKPTILPNTCFKNMLYGISDVSLKTDTWDFSEGKEISSLFGNKNASLKIKEKPRDISHNTKKSQKKYMVFTNIA